MPLAVAAGASGPTAASSGEPFGTLLSLHNRPFLAELWPELSCLPMDMTDADAPNPQVSSAECARRLQILLDKVSLESSSCRRHLLDPDFEGGFSAEEAALKANLVEFQQRLAANELARQSKGFGRVLQMLQRLGDRSEY